MDYFKSKNTVKIAAMNINVSTKKLLMNVLNFDFGVFPIGNCYFVLSICSMKSLSIIRDKHQFGILPEKSLKRWRIVA